MNPKNTLLSIEKALECGADWIEIDVYLVEGSLIVIHDDRLERTTNGTGKVAESSLAYLRSLDAGKGQKIPLLEEVFRLVQGRAGINVELKGPATAEPTAAFLTERFAEGWPRDQVLVSSFDHRMLRQIKDLDGNVRIGALLHTLPTTLGELGEGFGLYSVHPSLQIVNPQLVRDAHGLGLQAFVYTVNSPDDIARMRSMEVDGIFTDFPWRGHECGSASK